MTVDLKAKRAEDLAGWKADKDEACRTLEALWMKQEGEGLTEAEKLQQDEMTKLVKICDQKIKAMEAAERGKVYVPPQRGGRTAEFNTGFGMLEPEKPARSKPTIIATTGDKLRAAFSKDGPLSDGGFSSLGEFMETVGRGVNDRRMTPMASMGEALGSGGGFLVPPEHAVGMLDAALEDTICASRCEIHPMQSATKTIAGLDDSTHASQTLFGGLTAQWVGEGETASEEDAAARAIVLDAKKLFLLCKVTNELTFDAGDFERLLTDALIGAAAWHLDYACLRGTGAGQPKGALAAGSKVTSSKEAGQAATTITYKNLTTMFSRMHPGCVKNSIWVASQTTIPQLTELSIPIGTSGAHIPVMTTADGGFEILTRPVFFTEKLPTLGTEGDIMLVDFSQYALGLRKEVAVEKSIHTYFSSDHSSFRAILRADGMPKWSSAFTPSTGSTLSWCVTVEDRS